MTCVNTRINAEGTILVLRKVDDIPIYNTDQAAAERLTKRIGEKVKFEHEEELPIKYLCLAEDYNGVDINQCDDSILMS